MSLNPELQRNLWLEFSPQRLLVMPLLLAGVFYLSFQWGGAGGLAGVARWVYLLLALLWGTRLAGDAVADEVQARTWDWQRLSSLGAWTLTWGKLIGAPLYAWYGALIALLTLSGTALAAGADERLVALRVVLLLLAVLCAHAVALLVSLHGVRRRDSLATGRGLWALLAGLLASWPWLGLESDLASGGIAMVTWYDRFWLGLDFGLASALVFTALAWLACYRSMRAELQHRNAPWVWLAVSLFLMAYVAGFVGASEFPLRSQSRALVWWGGLFDLSIPAARWLMAMLAALGLCYVTALWEPKSRVLVVRLRSAIARGEWLAVAALVPRWLYALGLAAGAAAGVLLASSPAPAAALVRLEPATLVLAMLLFAVRDLGLLVLLHLAPNARRADLAWLIYLFVLYLLAPALVVAAGAPAASAWLLPRADLGLTAGVLPVLAQAVALLAAVVWRWRRLALSPPGGAPPA